MADLVVRRQGRGVGCHSTHGFGRRLLRHESLKNLNPLKSRIAGIPENSQGGLTHLNIRLAE